MVRLAERFDVPPEFRNGGSNTCNDDGRAPANHHWDERAVAQFAQVAESLSTPTFLVATERTLGLVPMAAGIGTWVGDSVWRIEGVEVPFVLSKTEVGGCYKVVQPCWLFLREDGEIGSDVLRSDAREGSDEEEGDDEPSWPGAGDEDEDWHRRFINRSGETAWWKDSKELERGMGKWRTVWIV